jgi:hypothetical protein
MKKKTSFRSWPMRKLGQKKCARGSHRVITPNGRPDVRIVVCCPPHAWSRAKRRCKKGLRAHLEYKVCGFKRKGKCPRRSQRGSTGRVTPRRRRARRATR